MGKNRRDRDRRRRSKKGPAVAAPISSESETSEEEEEQESPVEEDEEPECGKLNKKTYSASRVLEFKRNIASWVPHLAIRSGEIIGFQTKCLILLVTVSLAQVTPLRWVSGAIAGMSPTSTASTASKGEQPRLPVQLGRCTRASLPALLRTSSPQPLQTT